MNELLRQVFIVIQVHGISSFNLMNAGIAHLPQMSDFNAFRFICFALHS